MYFSLSYDSDDILKTRLQLQWWSWPNTNYVVPGKTATRWYPIGNITKSSTNKFDLPHSITPWSWSFSNKSTQLTYRWSLHDRSFIRSGENRHVVIDIRHLDFKVSRILYQLLVPIVHPGGQMVLALLLSVQRSGDEQVSFLIHSEDGVCSFTFDFKTPHPQRLARLQLWEKKEKWIQLTGARTQINSQPADLHK